MILVDSNVPMYLVGAAHPHKVDAQRALERLISGREKLVIDAGVLQEILHRYAAIDRRDAIQPAFDLLFGICDEILPIDAGVVQRARVIVLGRPQLSARGAVHVAVMQAHGTERILSFDAGFEHVPGVKRLAA